MVISRSHSSRSRDEEGKRIHFKTDKDYELSQTLADIQLKQKEHAIETEAKNQGFHYINLHGFPITIDALQVLNRDFCTAHKVVCFYLSEGEMRLGALDPTDSAITSKVTELEDKYRGTKILIYRISEQSLELAFKRFDAIPIKLESHDEGFELTAEALKKQQEKISSLKELNQILSSAPITEVFAIVIGSALKSGASDIHIEAETDDIKIRMRIDGVLHEVGILPSSSWGRIISRVKLIGGLKINIFDKPQDGRFTIYLDNDKIEVRVSTVPTSYGESVVMRLLRFSMESLTFESLGLTGYTLRVVEEQIARPNGMIIATGPTGSGKTTTLYAILVKLNSPETKILTLEDPIEYRIKGINQTQINTKAGLDFAKGLRSLLRQDPDIIMVGEIRDLETAEKSVNAALTGHLVLSTLHTNSSAGALPRFLAMGARTFLLAPAINAIIGQRLVRRLCPDCKQPYKAPAQIMDRIKEAVEPLKSRKDLGVDVDLTKIESLTIYDAKGCEKCSDLGYRGRIGLFEILTMNKDLEKMILGGNLSEYDVQETAQKHGMISLFQDGVLKVLQGITSISEIMRQTE